MKKQIKDRMVDSVNDLLDYHDAGDYVYFVGATKDDIDYLKGRVSDEDYIIKKETSGIKIEKL